MQIWEILDHAARLHGGREAFVCGETRLTYAQVYERVRRLAAALLALGARPGDRAGLMLLNCHRYSELYFALDYAGLVPLPLNHRLAAPEVRFIVDHAEPSLLIWGPEFGATLDACLPALPSVRTVAWSVPAAGRHGPDLEALIAAHEPLNCPPVQRGDDDLAQLYYTSGTTGNPKGAMLSERNVCSAALTNIATTGLDERDIYLRCSPAFHLADAFANFAVTLAGGRHVVIPAFEPAAFLEAVQRERVTVTHAVPTMINMLVNYPEVDRYDTSSLRLMLFGASPMPGERLRAAKRTSPAPSPSGTA